MTKPHASRVMEAPGSYVQANKYGTFRRRFPKIKGKAAKKQFKKYRHEVRNSKQRLKELASSKQISQSALMSPSKDETREG